MVSKWFCISLLILIVQNTVADTDYIDVAKYDNVYYNPNTQLRLKGELQDVSRMPFEAPGIAYRGMSCSCNNLTCSCCTGINLTVIKFNNRVCANFTYSPEDFAISAKLIVNERVLLNRDLSAKNPPPFCFPFVPLVSFCVRFYDIYMAGKNLHACMDFETHVIRWPILILHFDCVQIGMDGVSWTKPQDGSNVLPISTLSEPEVYDEVNFETESNQLGSNQTSTLTPEEEVSIGQLKL